MTGLEVLDLPMQDNDAGAKTIREYLVCLAQQVWVENEGFSGKRPFGNSGWDQDVIRALVRGKAIEGTIDEDGWADTDPLAVDAAVQLAIAVLKERR